MHFYLLGLFKLLYATFNAVSIESPVIIIFFTLASLNFYKVGNVNGFKGFLKSIKP